VRPSTSAVAEHMCGGRAHVRPSTCATSPAAGGGSGVSPRQTEILPASAAEAQQQQQQQRPSVLAGFARAPSSPRFCPLLPQKRSGSTSAFFILLASLAPRKGVRGHVRPRRHRTPIACQPPPQKGTFFSLASFRQ
jgi:hypothetical protein